MTGHGASYSRESIARIESGRQDIIEPLQANALAKTLPITVAEICSAMGYELEDPGLSGVEAELVALARMVRPDHQRVIQEACRAVTRGLLRLDDEGQLLGHPAASRTVSRAPE